MLAARSIAALAIIALVLGCESGDGTGAGYDPRGGFEPTGAPGTTSGTGSADSAGSADAGRGTRIAGASEPTGNGSGDNTDETDPAFVDGVYFIVAALTEPLPVNLTMAADIRVGADVIITQLFYQNQSFYDFVDRCRALGITQPIVPGLLPILDLVQIQRITEMCGSRISDRLLGKLIEAGEDQGRVRELGIEHTVEQALDLLKHGVPGIHFYVLNQHSHISEIMERIRPALKSSG